MATFNRHRKLMEDPTNITGSLIDCLAQCDPQYNPTGFCGYDCIMYCPSFCHVSSHPPSESPGTTPYPLSPRLRPDHRHSSPFSLPLKLSMIFIVTTFIYTLYRFYIWHRSRHHSMVSPPLAGNLETHDENNLDDVLDHPIWYIRTRGLEANVVNGIKVVKFDKTDGVVDGSNCTVCLSEFEAGDMVRVLPNCKHAFHISCIDTWLGSHTNCPLCRAKIASDTVDASLDEGNHGDLRGGLDIGVSVVRDNDQGESSGSSGMRNGGRDEEEMNNDSHPKIDE